MTAAANPTMYGCQFSRATSVTSLKAVQNRRPGRLRGARGPRARRAAGSAPPQAVLIIKTDLMSPYWVTPDVGPGHHIRVTVGTIMMGPDIWKHPISRHQECHDIGLVVPDNRQISGKSLYRESRYRDNTLARGPILGLTGRSRIQMTEKISKVQLECHCDYEPASEPPGTDSDQPHSVAVTRTHQQTQLLL
jgi:hypothetical protein